ncbi:uncharacterized protein LOC127374296 isoform X1 [Dicentrarchus labrax]|uniref:uncharacterized protein LOC127374296 isoform X1 n=1 Tax=Dicentrarchus labrax TaxID=13489 RepID=UPI0021F5F86E|nr:uncharacterized protein LOC127374296 isoform X1 [Dicentrarchus labrax]
MSERLAALILLSSVYLIETAELRPPSSVTVVEVGGNYTLRCPVSQEGKFFQLYKLPPGYMIQVVATGSYNNRKLDAQFNNSRFNITEEKTHYLLTIRNISKEDEATYFCQTGAAYKSSVVNAVFLAVNDRNQQKSVIVKQRPETASVQPGHSVTLQCSLLPKNKETRVQCPGEHNVYWFRAISGQSHPDVIYTHRNSSDEQEERSCVYSLSKTITDSSDTGTYYCAVVSCGEILFGEGTKVETTSQLDPVTLVLGVLLACCVAVNIFLIFHVNQRRVCEHCKGLVLSAGAKTASHNPRHDRMTADQLTDMDGDAEEVNYAALDFSTRRVRKKRGSPQECVYSAVNAHYHTQHHPSF